MGVKEARAVYAADLVAPVDAVPPGYKQSDVGVIPEGWSILTIGDFAIKVGSGLTPTGGSANYKKFGRPFVRSQNVGWGSLQLDDLAFIDEATHQQFSATEIQYLDILLNITGASIGRSSIADRRLVGGNVNQHVCIIRLDQTQTEPRFLSFFLLSRHGQDQIDSFQAGGNREGLNFKQVRAIKVTLPPTKGEQEAIAEALSDADALIESLQQLIAKKRQIKQGTMRALLTGKQRLPGFTGEWVRKTLGELFDFSGGYSASRDQLSTEGHCYLHYGDIHTSTKTFVDVAVERQDLPKLDIPLSKVNVSSLLKDGDVVFVDASEDDEGTSRHMVISNADDVPFISGLHTIVATSKTNELDHLFRRYCFQAADIKQQFRFFAVGTKVSGVSKSNIGKIELALPPISEQTAIAEVVTDMDAEIAALETRLAKTRQLKRGMMQQLLTGRIRLI